MTAHVVAEISNISKGRNYDHGKLLERCCMLFIMEPWFR
jgi:hypothetical protein